MHSQEVYWLEEIGQGDNDLVGKKSANLGEMTRVPGIRVPPGFAITIGAYDNFVRDKGLDRKIVDYLRERLTSDITHTNLQLLQEISQEIRRMIESEALGQFLKEDIAAHYKALCEKCKCRDIAVSVRSAGAKSHPGQYETYLNVNGLDKVLERILRVWSSSYNSVSLSAALRQGMTMERIPLLGVCILKMVNAKAAGVCLSVHPISGEVGEAVVESNWGLGESVVSGGATPDRFIVNKVDMKIKEVTVGKKEKRLVIKDNEIAEDEILPDRRNDLSLSEDEVIGIVERAKRLEMHFGFPQDIEWAVEKDLRSGDNIVLLQARPQKGIPKKKCATEKIADMIMRRHRM